MKSFVGKFIKHDRLIYWRGVKDPLNVEQTVERLHKKRWQILGVLQLTTFIYKKKPDYANFYFVVHIVLVLHVFHFP